MFCSAVVLYTLLVLEPEYKQTLPCPSGDLKACAASNALFHYYVEIIHIVVKAGAPLVAFVGVASHPNKNNALASNVGAGLIWHITAKSLDMCAVPTPYTQYLEWLVLCSSCLAYVLFAIAFMSQQEELATAPVLGLKYALPFAIIGYYLVSELFHTDGLLFSAHANVEHDPLTFGLLLLKVMLPCFVGWAAASRVGYGSIGWRSRRATKQILSVVGCLFLLFGMMVEFQGQAILPLSTFMVNDLLRTRVVFVCETMMVGFFATSAILHADDE